MEADLLNANLLYIAYQINERNKLAAVRTCYRNRRRNYKNWSKKAKIQNEALYERACEDLSKFRKSTLKEFRRALKRVNARLVSDYSNGYHAVYQKDEKGSWANLLLNKSQIEHYAMEYEALMALEKHIKEAK